MHVTGGSLRHFGLFSTPKRDPDPKPGPRSARQQVRDLCQQINRIYFGMSHIYSIPSISSILYTFRDGHRSERYTHTASHCREAVCFRELFALRSARVFAQHPRRGPTPPVTAGTPPIIAAFPDLAFLNKGIVYFPNPSHDRRLSINTPTAGEVTNSHPCSPSLFRTLNRVSL